MNASQKLRREHLLIAAKSYRKIASNCYALENGLLMTYLLRDTQRRIATLYNDIRLTRLETELKNLIAK